MSLQNEDLKSLWQKEDVKFLIVRQKLITANISINNDPLFVL